MCSDVPLRGMMIDNVLGGYYIQSDESHDGGCDGHTWTNESSEFSAGRRIGCSVRIAGAIVCRYDGTQCAYYDGFHRYGKTIALFVGKLHVEDAGVGGLRR